MSFRRGLAVGKFCPLLRGHMLVIDTALAQCDEVLVLSYTAPAFAHCSSAARRRWLQALYPQVQTYVLPEQASMPDNDADGDLHRHFTGNLCWNVLGQPVDAVFTSEDYGEGFARYLSAHFAHAPVQHVCVDQARTLVPVSGTAIRANPHAHRAFLDPRVYADFVDRVAILGGESSGKTTLAQALAERLGTCWAPEYGRECWIEQGGVLDYADMLAIGQAQVAREQRMAQSAQRWLVCDTTPLTTAFYSQHMFGALDPALGDLAKRTYAHTFLCAPDFAFVQDGTRQDDAFRHSQHAWYQAQLAQRGVTSTILTGGLAQRLACVLEVVGYAFDF